VVDCLRRLFDSFRTVFGGYVIFALYYIYARLHGDRQTDRRALPSLDAPSSRWSGTWYGLRPSTCGDLNSIQMLINTWVAMVTLYNCYDMAVQVSTMDCATFVIHWLYLYLVARCMVYGTHNALTNACSEARQKSWGTACTPKGARLELSASNCRDGKCRTKQLWKAKARCCNGSQKIICLNICWN